MLKKRGACHFVVNAATFSRVITPGVVEPDRVKMCRIAKRGAAPDPCYSSPLETNKINWFAMSIMMFLLRTCASGELARIAFLKILRYSAVAQSCDPERYTKLNGRG